MRKPCRPCGRRRGRARPSRLESSAFVRTLRRVTRIVAVLLLLAILPTACGSDSDDNADWATAATRLCRDLERELATVDPPREIEEPDELAAFVRGTATSVGAWIERMRELEPDAADAEQVASML